MMKGGAQALTVILIILFILCVLLLLPVRAKASFGDGKWAVAVYYAFFRIFHKESKEKPEPEVPKKPEDLPEGEAPPLPKPEPKPEAASKPEKPKPKPQPEAVPKPETVTAKPEPDPKPEPEPEAESAAPVDPEQLADTVETPELKPKKQKKPKKPKKKPASEAETPAEAEAPKKKKRGIRGFIERVKPHSLSDILGLAKDGFAALTPALKFLTKHIHFRHIRLYLAIGTDDPANTATLYGKICAAAYNLLGAMQCWFDMQADEFRILADFYNDKITFRGSLELRISPMAAIILVLILGCKFLWRTIRRFRREDKEAALREKESAPLPQA